MAEDRETSQARTSRIRLRASKRNVASQPVRAQMLDNDAVVFSKIAHHQLLVPLAVEKSSEAAALEQLEDLANSYVRWRKKPQSSREVAKRDLLSLANYCDDALVAKLNDNDLLVCKIASLDDLAETVLWAALLGRAGWPEERIAVYWLRENPDPAFVAEAARVGASNLKGGDYSDLDLHYATAELIDIFEDITGRIARAGRPSSDTPICMLAFAFFEIVDPSIKHGSIWNSLDRELRARRRKNS